MTAYDLTPKTPKKPAFAPTADAPHTFVSGRDILNKTVHTFRPLEEYRYDAHRDGYWVPDSEIYYYPGHLTTQTPKATFNL